jgi:hypothetical protein
MDTSRTTSWAPTPTASGSVALNPDCGGILPPQSIGPRPPEEQTWLWNLWAVWYQFAYDPRQYPTDATRESRAKIDQVISKYRRELTRRLEALTQARFRIHAEIDRWSDGAGLWVVLDVDTAADTDAGLAAVIATTIDTLRPPPDFEALERYALDLVLGEVHFVGLIRGKALEPTRRTLMISTLPQPDDELPGWRLLPLPIADSVWPQLGIPLHPETLAETARNLREESRSQSPRSKRYSASTKLHLRLMSERRCCKSTGAVRRRN